MFEVKSYTKLPVTIEAFILQDIDKLDNTQAEEHNAALANFLEGCEWESTNEGVNITTSEGVMLARPNDYIIKGVKGEFYPCKPDIFALTYGNAS